MPRKRKEDTGTEATEEPVRMTTRKRATTEDSKGVQLKKAKAVEDKKKSKNGKSAISGHVEEQESTPTVENGKEEGSKKAGRGRTTKAVKVAEGPAIKKETIQDSKSAVKRKPAKTSVKQRTSSSSEDEWEDVGGGKSKSAKKEQKSKVSVIKTEKSQDSREPVAGKKTVKAKAIQQRDPTSDSSSESEWEDVAEHPYAGPEPAAADDGPSTSKSIQITVNAPKTKKELDVEGELRRALKRFRKELQENLHKAHLLALVACGRHLSSICNDELNQAVALSMVPVGYTDFGKDSKTGKEQLKRFVKWFCSGFTLADENAADSELAPSDLGLAVRRNLQTRVAFSYKMLTLCLVTTIRALGFDARVVINVHPITRKMESESNTPDGTEKKSGAGSRKTSGKAAAPKKSKAEKPKSGKEKDAKSSDAGKKNAEKRSAMEYLSSDSDSDWSPLSAEKKQSRSETGVNGKEKKAKSDLKKDTPKAKASARSSVAASKKTSSKASTDDGSEISVKTEPTSEYWAEIYMENIEQWLCVNCIDSSVDNVDTIKKVLTPPVLYCLSFDKDLALKDVTSRYASDFMSIQSRRLRTDAVWLTKTFALFRSTKRIRNRLEDMQLEANLSKQSLPTSISDFKNHPLYVLKRDLLKFEAIYPPNMKPVGYFRTEAIYPRSAVHTLHSKDTWRKEALSVREAEEPYKIVKGRPKWDSATKTVLDNREVAVFGRWQTEPYRSAPAKDGIVPRNEFGNVYLFKQSMLPPGTVHLQLPGLLSVAKKMDVDCVPAMTGWDFHGRASHPVLDGFVVCEEYKDALVAAWEEEQANAEVRERERRSNKAIQNWRRLIKAAFVREKLRRKFKSQMGDSTKPPQDQEASTSKEEKPQKVNGKGVKKKPDDESSAGEMTKDTVTTRNRTSWPQCRHEFTGNHEEL